MNRKQAIIYVHGADCTVKGQGIDQLVEDLVNASDFSNISLDRITDGVTGEKEYILSLQENGSSQVQYYLYEAYWGDLKEIFQEERPLVKLFQSTGLLFYWLFSGIWKSLRTAPKLAFPLISSFLLIFFWYLSLFLIAFGDLAHYLSDYPRIADFFEKVAQVNTWGLWGLLTLLLSAFPTGKIVNTAYFTRQYLRNYGLRKNIGNRVSGTLNRAFSSGQFNSYLILAHSFGSVITADFLAQKEFELGEKSSLRVITLGASLSFISNRSQRLKEAISRAQVNRSVTQWQDFYSPKDWLCSRTIKNVAAKNFESFELSYPVPFSKQVSGESHTMYFKDESVLKAILGNER